MKQKGILYTIISISLLLISTEALASSGKISVARAFYEFAHQNNTQKIEALQHRGYSIESIDERGYNPLCISVTRQDKRAYKVLLSYGAQKKPSCLREIPETAYKRFFGSYPIQEKFAKTYTSDTPYLLGATALGAGALATALIFKGDTSGGSGGDGSDDHDGDKNPDNPDNPDPKCPENSHYNPGSKSCICNSGYDTHGDKYGKCYLNVDNCKQQNLDKCNRCVEGYKLDQNLCYKIIENCQKQEKDKCTQCRAGYGNYGTKMCYNTIQNCERQEADVCTQCKSGFGNYGNERKCYQNVPNCDVQIQDICKQCQAGYNTYGDPYKCYDKNPCAAYENSRPTDYGKRCICDDSRGYTGDPYNEGCSLTTGGEYQEGDEREEEWNNYNELYCNSHGKYEIESKTCLCYDGYAGKSCATCAENYKNFNGVCYPIKECPLHMVQDRDDCVCIEGYIDYYDDKEGYICIKKIDCGPHREQVGPDKCQCKDNFDEKCEKCLPGYKLEPEADICYKEQEEQECEGHWTGEDCDICPSQFMLSPDGKTCGAQCAINRKPIKENPDCTKCADGYEWSDRFGNCVTNKCLTGEIGYKYYIDENGIKYCDCDKEKGYRLNNSGMCELMGEDLIGEKKRNINNSQITLINDGEMRDVYGMKPIKSEDEEGNVTYYDDVYNAKSTDGEIEAIIDITNKHTGNNKVYGIYSNSNIYNASTFNPSQANMSTKGTINIIDFASKADIVGINAIGDTNTIYNSFTFSNNNSETTSTSDGSINISRDNYSQGDIIGINGKNIIYNAYAITRDGTASHVQSTGKIDINHQGFGNVIGIKGDGENKSIYNSVAYLDSAVSNAISSGTITLKGNREVIGIMGKGSVSNSETLYNKNYNMKKEFASKGIINVETSSILDAVYGIYTNGDNTEKANVYNAKGYNTLGVIMVKSTNGGSAYGIYSGAQTYDDLETNKIMYNNTYNAFRSSAIYGDKKAVGVVGLEIDGYNTQSQKVTGIYAEGNVYNAYANSGSDVALDVAGNVIIKDNSKTPGTHISGIESSGATIANAYSMGQKLNTATKVVGNIGVEVSGTKNGAVDVSGIYSIYSNPQSSKIYNAALVNDNNSVEGNILVSSTQSNKAPQRMYGIYASSISKGDTGNTAQPKYVYNAYAENSDKGKVNGTINVLAPNNSTEGEGEYYGIYVENGYAYNAYNSPNSTANVTGIINVEAAGGSKSGKVVGMSGKNKSKLNNSGNSLIKVTSSGTGEAIGMRGENTDIYNNAQITVSAKSADAYGIYLDKGSVINDIDGKINVSGNSRKYGIYAMSDGSESGKAVVINRGEINISGENGEGVGIYATGKTSTVKNEGVIKINGVICQGENCNGGQAIVLNDGATYENNGKTTSTGSLNFDEMGGNVIIGKNGQFEAHDDISGNLKVSIDTVQNSFDKMNEIKNALSANDISNLNLKSDSYLYNSATRENAEGKYDIVMNMKDFSEVTDSDKAEYLDKNYNNQKLLEMFNYLKNTSNAKEYSMTEAKLFGTSVLPNITQENLKVQRSLDRNIMSDLFKTEGNVRKIVGADATLIGQDDRDTLQGYDMNSQSMYSLYDKKLNNKFRAGLGVSFTHMDTDYNDDSQRKNFMVQGYLPVTYMNNNGVTAVTLAKIGYSDGDYTRRGMNGNYKGDTQDITYGISNEIRFKKEYGGLTITPFIGLNLNGWYQDAIKERGDNNALEIASDQTVSIESALGLYLDKNLEFSNENKLNISLGAGYYHEFADPYEGADAHHKTGIGKYKLQNKNNLNGRDRGMLSAKLNYDYKDFSIYGELMQYLEKEYPVKVDLGVKYKF